MEIGGAVRASPVLPRLTREEVEPGQWVMRDEVVATAGELFAGIADRDSLELFSRGRVGLGPAGEDLAERALVEWADGEQFGSGNRGQNGERECAPGVALGVSVV